MSIVKKIAEWAATLPPWQSDAVRRIFVQEAISPEDEGEILGMLFSTHKFLDESIPKCEPVPFPALVAGEGTAKGRIVLKELHSVLGVNALIPDQSLKFALQGLTVHYGENGAGKSGYIRILKHSCHARAKGHPILSNIAAAKSEEASATIELSIGDKDIAVKWKKSAPPSDHLTEIAVFDSHCARVFLDEANEVVFLPYGCDIFGKLIALHKSLKEKIKARLAAIPQRLTIVDEFSKSTKAGALVHGLTKDSDPSAIDKLSTLSAAETERIVSLKQLIALSKTNSPKQQAADLRRKKARFETFSKTVAAAASQFSVGNVDRLKKLSTEAAIANEAATLATASVFKDEPIATTGSDAWRLLFDSAKAFSVTDAYPGTEFPATDADKVCVFCQQPLTDTAQQRLKRFNDYVTNDAAVRKEKCDLALAEARETFSSASLDLPPVESGLIEEIGAFAEKLPPLITAFFEAAKKRQAAIEVACETSDWTAITSIPVSPHELINASVEAIETKAKELDAADKPEEMKRLETELAELTDRELLAKYVADFKAHIEDKKKEGQLNACDKALDSGAITRFGSELTAGAVTEQFEACLADELKSFSVNIVEVKVRKIGDKGRTKHQLALTRNVPPSQVLSEGEQRIVAIACFLAELAAADHDSPMIFDDPVSSLDHRFRDQVARRLVKESLTRQVVVFTHDITMLLALERECAEQQAFLHVQTIQRHADGSGACSEPGSKPWHVQSTKDRLGFLKQACAPLKKLSESDPDKFNAECKSIYGKLREAWERAVEEVVLNETISRFSPAVRTQQLKLVSIEATDYVTIDQEMSKCSTRFEGHDTAPALALTPLNHDDPYKDVLILETFVKDMRARQDKTKKMVEEQLKAPIAKLSDSRASDANDDSSLVA